ncbi:accessory Sec system translocase SecA2 [Actinoplanes sichuanensis]|uniref:Protein translocase subunit SecA n=1 Tax=Actinoplanes sichuanensis TaxID=512349 RepID=A0ABW4AT94_9ACTN|nr:accessory Sec system translocase SecA2 [Actinoplanes sichuanensis]
MALPGWVESLRRRVVRPPGSAVDLRPLWAEARGTGTPRAELCAVARETAWQTLGLRPYDEQLVGALALIGGRVVQMATGEGKTLTAAIAAAELSRGGPVHVLTVNDYLARRDVEWMWPFYERLGVSVGWVTGACTPEERRMAYARDVTYVSVNEVGFDFLRDGLCTDAADRVQRPLHAVIVDEADSILVDEARVPLVLAGSTGMEADLAPGIAVLVRAMIRDEHYTVADENQAVHLTPAGIEFAEEGLGGVDLYQPENLDLLTAVNLALYASALLTRDVDYIVRDGRVELVDGFRGRVAGRRRWPDGLQAAVEAEEGLTGSGGGTILATITLQALLGQYRKVAGMTGTALPVGEQLREFYGLEIAVLPPHRPCIRLDAPDRVYETAGQRDAAVVAEVARTHATGRPILLATASVADSEALGARLSDAGIPCTVLNARNDAREAAIVAEAGLPGAVTVSTQMTGRGVDIRLGGSDQADHARVAALGGLYVIGVGRHDSSRVDDQVRGRAGRQGDPGGSVFFVSREDELLLRYGQRPAADAQRLAEQVDLQVHRNTWRYHYLLEQHRTTIAAYREQILTTDRAPEVMARFHPVDRRLTAVARQLLLFHLDQAWADHLSDMAELREGIHLRSIANLDPLDEFHRAAIPAFRQLIPAAEQRAADAFGALDPAAPDPVIDRPSATWTYVVDDTPFEAGLEQFFSGLRNLLRSGWSSTAGR